MEHNKSLILYHGSKSGIHGEIQPLSRDRCDFGKGFYMESNHHQPLTLICNYPNAILYTCNVTVTNLNILNIEVGLDWALLIAYHRGKMETVKDTPLYHRFATMCNGYDMVIGSIANDRMFVILDRFFNGEITDLALIHCLSALELGKQYVAITQKACDHITIIDEQVLTDEYKNKLKQESEGNRKKGITMAYEICRRYRREGRFFDEILQEGEVYDKPLS